MKIKYVKFSDERRKEFCIKTVIGQENDKNIVYKEAIFGEGIEHIKRMTESADKLRQHYEADVCGVEYIDGKAFFEYVQGESLEKRYQKAMNKGDTAEIEKLMKLHKSIILGKNENQVIFNNRDCTDINEIFGDCSIFEGEKALKLANYDAIASNIIFVESKPVFIDYEWVFEAKVPVDIVVYHCIKDYYIHYPEMEGVYPIERAMSLLDIREDKIELLDNTYHSFYDYVISDGIEEGFALMKAICLKNTKNVYEKLNETEHENLVNMCECNRLQGVIDGLIEENTDYSMKCCDYESQMISYKSQISDYENQVSEYEDRIEGLQAKLLCFGSRKLLRKIKGVYYRWKR